MAEVVGKALIVTVVPEDVAEQVLEFVTITV